MLDISDPSLWSYPEESLDIGIKTTSQPAKFDLIKNTFDSIAIDTFGLGEPGTNERRGWVQFSVAAYPGM